MARTVDISGLLPSNSQSDSPHCGSELRKHFKRVLQDIQLAAVVLSYNSNVHSRLIIVLTAKALQLTIS